MKKVIVGLVMTAVLSNVVLAAEFESMNVTGNESVQSVDMNNDMLFMNVDGEVMTLEEMEAIEGDGWLGAMLGGSFGIILCAIAGITVPAVGFVLIGSGMIAGSALPR